MNVLLGLIGRRLSHSLSQVYFREKFRQLGLTNADYLLFELDFIGQLPKLLQTHRNLIGFNVTIPYKQEVMKYLDEVDDTAARVGAVNTVVADGGYLKGYNTDVVGFEKTLLPLMDKFNTQNIRALVLGTGGSSKSVTFVLRKHGIGFTAVTSSIQQANALSARHTVLTYEELTETVVANHLLIVNTTPLGMQPDVASFPDIPYDAITSAHVLIDLVYNPLETQFLKFGSVKNATCVNGLTMLYAQADAAWELWKSRVVG